MSGADEALVSYAIHLRRAGHLQAVVLFQPPARSDPYRRRLRQAGVPIRCVGPTSPVACVVFALSRGLSRLLPPRAKRSLRRGWRRLAEWAAQLSFRRCSQYFAGSGADVIHVVTPDPGAAVMIRAGHAASMPVLYQELGTPYFMPELAVHYERFSAVIPLCSEVAALSPRLALDWTGKFPWSRPISVLPFVYDDPLDGGGPARPPGDAVTFGFAARLEHGKGPLVLIAAFARLERAFPGSRLKLAGTGPQEREARERVRALGLDGACEFTGAYTRPESKNAFMRALDVFVQPTLAEGTPNSIIEAMAHGRPVVASAVGGIPDMLGSDAGMLVPASDAPALAAAMTRLAADPELRARMGRAARRRYEELFSPEAVMPLVIERYRRLAGRAGAGEASTHPWSSPVSAVTQRAVAPRDSSENGPTTGPAPATVVRRSTRR